MNRHGAEKIEIDGESNQSLNQSPKHLTKKQSYTKAKPEHTLVSMRNTKNMLKTNTYFSEILKKVRPDVCLQENYSEEIQKGQQKRRKLCRFEKQKVYEKERQQNSKVFKPDLRRRSWFTTNVPVHQHSLSPSNAQNWVAERKSFRAFDAKSRHFSFCGMQEEEANQ